jgi:hypothetical protein
MPRVMLQIVASLTNHCRGIINDRNMFIVLLPILNLVKQLRAILKSDSPFFLHQTHRTLTLLHTKYNSDG